MESRCLHVSLIFNKHVRQRLYNMELISWVSRVSWIRMSSIWILIISSKFIAVFHQFSCTWMMKFQISLELSATCSIPVRRILSTYVQMTISDAKRRRRRGRSVQWTTSCQGYNHYGFPHRGFNAGGPLRVEICKLHPSCTGYLKYINQPFIFWPRITYSVLSQFNQREYFYSSFEIVYKLTLNLERRCIYH